MVKMAFWKTIEDGELREDGYLMKEQTTRWASVLVSTSAVC